MNNHLQAKLNIHGQRHFGIRFSSILQMLKSLLLITFVFVLLSDVFVKFMVFILCPGITQEQSISPPPLSSLFISLTIRLM